MRARRYLALASFLALTVALPATAYAADKTGNEGRLKSVEVNSPSADTYLQYHGRLFVTAKKSTTEYRWGGTSCGSRTLSPEMVDLLVDTVRNHDNLKIAPRYQDGQGSSKCLVGFTIRHKNGSDKSSSKPKPS